jgi:phasin family protein
MTSDFFDQLTGAGQSSYKTFQTLGEINTKAIKKLTDINFTLATLGIELTMEQAKLLTGAKSYNDLFSVGSGLAAEYGNKMMEINREVSGVLAESSEEFIDWVKESFDAAGKAGVAAAPAKPAPAKTSAKKTSTRKAA